MSQQIAQDDEGFEIRSLADSLDEGFDPDDDRPPAYDPERAQRKPVPSQQLSSSPQPPLARPRESLDGETIFAVGEEGDEDREEWDDADDGADEGKKLTG